MIGHIGKELYCVKKSILVTFCAFFSNSARCILWSLSLCSYKIKSTICENLLIFFSKTLHIIITPNICFTGNPMCEICNNLDELSFFSHLKMIKTQR